jgi:hypothetical protein
LRRQTETRRANERVLDCTLLDVARAICDVTTDDRESVAVLRHVLCFGHVRLRDPEARSREGSADPS